MRNEDRHLKLRGRFWHYQRRVPLRFRDVDKRIAVRKSLRTPSREIARLRRDALAETDNQYWAALAANTRSDAAIAGISRIKKDYQRRQIKALTFGVIYNPYQELIEPPIRSILKVDKTDCRPSDVKTNSCLTVAEAFELYCEKIDADKHLYKSPGQKRAWRKAKERAIKNFVMVVGDKPILELTRQDALDFYNWWMNRVKSQNDREKCQPATAKRDLGTMRKLCTAYFNYIGQEDRKNPFRNLNFGGQTQDRVPAFDNAWVLDKILAPGALDGINASARLIAYTLIETGCRPSEIANLTAEDIKLDTEIPYISICPKNNRELKTKASRREIPLVGVALAAMQHAPKGFPRYFDKSDLLSANLMKAFRRRGLFPTKRHVIYSFRHSFENRMKEAEIDYELRCILMGHRTGRPYYGSGGTLKFRRDQLKKIIHPFSAELF